MYHEQHRAAGRGRSSRHRRPFGRGQHAAVRRHAGLYVAALVVAAAAIGSWYASGSSAGSPGSVAQAAPAPSDHTSETALLESSASAAQPRLGDEPSRQPVFSPDAQPKPSPTPKRTTAAPRTPAAAPRPGSTQAGPVGTPNVPTVTSAPPVVAPASPSPSGGSPSADPSPSGTDAPSPSPSDDG
ncbi:hypothetical protein [Dactylosporangium sp. NPDC051484]|uniref:hypothetical protein n=1 Tax=Dactylosporangium sp. NPDC051484 TaxID=3154942 RepID=UPI00344C1947